MVAVTHSLLSGIQKVIRMFTFQSMKEGSAIIKHSHCIHKLETADT